MCFKGKKGLWYLVMIELSL